MSKRTTVEERIRIMELVQAGLTDEQIAKQLGWAKETVRKWRRRNQQGGREALASVMGRPRVGVMSSHSAEMKGTVQRWRQAHPGWGAKTLHTEMTLDERLRGQRVPAAATIGRFLHEQGMTRSYQRHSALPTSGSDQAGAPHAVWEMDARGYSYIPEVGMVTLINLNDRFTHLRLLSYPCVLGQQRVTRHATTEDYQIALRLAFTDWGLPEALQVDHDPVFFDSKTKSPFPSQLHLWLLALGVRLTFGRLGLATDQGMTERSHQTWAAQALQGQRYEEWLDLYRALRQRRDFLNYHLPMAALAERAPLQAFPEARCSARPYRPEWEKEMLDLTLVHAYLAQGRWFRRVGENGTVSLGGSVYYIGNKWARHQLDVTFQPTDQHFVSLDEAGQLVKRMPIKALTIEALMGELAPFVTLPEFQLCLPFTYQAQRAVRLFESLEV